MNWKHTAVLTAPERAACEHALTKPIVDGGQQLSVLYFREPTAGDLMAAAEEARLTQEAADLALIARLAGLLPQAAQSLGMPDLKAIKALLKGFFPDAWDALDEAKGNALAVQALALKM